ncbi:protein kinase [Gordonia sp. (in: high G+C Gram-positive bacteria)]|uniref:protein kinase domain-containing protein n=1 Tax=Gordonia sp. (in: high G+C Gram-positive bacteria) TaxID=84139 RepID=UPI00352795DF
MELTPGTTFAGYTVISLLGRGGMGHVYLVENPALGRREALKVVTAGASPDFAERFAREARIAAGLHHPSIITVYAYGVTGGVPWFTMRHLDGNDLNGARLPDTEIHAVAQHAAAALDYAHDHGVIHRDIKPANIFLTRDTRGQIETATVLDFGIARPNGVDGLTGTGMFIGTLKYSAPEAIDGREPTAAADQYSLACTLYELFTGAPPFTEPTPIALMRAHADKPVPPISSRRPDLARLDPVFDRALAKDAAERYPDCRTFASALGAAASSPTMAPTLEPPVTAATPATAAPTVRHPSAPAEYSPTVHRPAPLPLGAPAPHTPSSSRRRGPLIAGIVAIVVLSLIAAGVAGYFLVRGSGAADSRVSMISTDQGRTCAIRGGEVYCWGGGSRTPARIGTLNGATAVSVSGGTACAVDHGKAYCWNGGTGTTTSSAEPAPVPGLPGDVTAISTDGSTTCAIADAGLYCWGGNSRGQLGDGTTAARSTPARIAGLSHVTDVSVEGASEDGSTVCAIADGAPYCWGDNLAGQVGDGTTENRPRPVHVKDLPTAQAIRTGWGTSCAISAKRLYCWGTSLNTDTRRPSTPSVNSALDGDVTAIGVSSRVCAVAGDDVFCWGTGRYSRPPARVSGAPNGVTSLSVGAVNGLTTACVISDGAAWCWGSNVFGDVGDGTNHPADTPVKVGFPA